MIVVLGGVALRAQASPPASFAVRPVTQDTTVRVDLDRVSVGEALRAIVNASGIVLNYSARTVAVPKVVTLHVRNVTARAAILAVLDGTGLFLVTQPDGQLAIVNKSPPQGVPGVIMGHVIDAASDRGLAGVTVSVQGTKLAVLTDESGAYRIAGVPPGKYHVIAHRIGYGSGDKTATIRGNDTVVVVFSLSSIPAHLEEVITTGSGDRKRLEVGNSIATINADSIVPNTPIRNLSDLLRGRAAGVSVSSTSGAVGSGSRIRIRGVSSLVGSSDPIIIIDGVRADAGYSQAITGITPLDPNLNFGGGPTDLRSAGVNQVTGNPATSRLNDIDPETIENIEVLKGPSAATLYGSDAANGVIVITTKRGKPGPTRWTVFTQGGVSTMHATFPEAWRGWGNWPGQPGNTECSLAQVAAQQCTQDSVSHFNPLNRDATSPLNTGHSAKYGATVSGGSTQVQYFVGSDYDDEVGLEKLPSFDETRFMALRNGSALPDWAIRPNTNNALRVNSSLTAQLGTAANVALSSNFIHQYHRDNASYGFITQSFGSAGFPDTISQGWGQNGSPGTQFLTLSTDVTNRGTGGLQGNWNPATFLSMHGTGGIDYANVTDKGLTPPNIIPGTIGATAQRDITTIVRTLDVGATADVPLVQTLHSRSSWGGQYRRQDQDGTTVSGVGLADGSDVVNGATSRDAGEFHSASAIEGWYLEQSFALNERAYITGAVRGDMSSSFGSDAKSVYYPKWSASWLLSQEPFFPGLPGVNNLRLRAAFGHAGVQPTIDARFRSFRSGNGYLNNGSVSGITVSTLGNPGLRPERSTELEGGFDLSLWQDRATFEVTMYNKVTRDALITRSLPPSFGLPSRQENIGRVDNRGFELLATLRPIETQPFSWSATLNVAHDRNRLISLGPTSLPPVPNLVGAGQGRYVEGYPLNGFWDRPILSYSDVNGDGVIEQSEIRLGDSAVYRGQPFPKATASLYNNLSFLSGWVTLGVGLDFTYGITQLNSGLWGQCQLSRCQWANDPNTSLLDQAYVVATRGIENSGSTWGFLETGSFARLNELSLTFTLPQRLVARLRSQGATFSIMGRNLKLWSDYHGADPEVNTNNFQNQLLDAGGVPQPREWSARLNLRF